MLTLKHGRLDTDIKQVSGLEPTTKAAGIFWYNINLLAIWLLIWVSNSFAKMTVSLAYGNTVSDYYLALHTPSLAGNLWGFEFGSALFKPT